VPPRDWPLRVQDILDQISLIREHTAGYDWAAFAASTVVQGDVMYRIGVIGEAVAGSTDEIKERYPAIPWRVIRNMRNVVTHIYFGVDLERVWAVVRDDLGPLEHKLRSLLADEGHGPG
jgi:uncharacterized protein with HEPN domain